jgi:hypothetical protein
MNRREIERATTASLHARRTALDDTINAMLMDGESDDVVAPLVAEYDRIDDEIEARFYDDEPVDYDQHDRSAAESERLDNIRQER